MSTPAEARAKKLFLEWEDSVPGTIGALQQLDNATSRSQQLYEAFKELAPEQMQSEWGVSAGLLGTTNWQSSGKAKLEGILDRIALQIFKDPSDPTQGVVTRNELLESMKTVE